MFSFVKYFNKLAV